jgi:hypothetical protein
MAVCWTRTGSAIALSVSLSLSRNACRSSLACSASSARLRSVMSRTVARIPHLGVFEQAGEGPFDPLPRPIPVPHAVLELQAQARVAQELRERFLAAGTVLGVHLPEGVERHELFRPVAGDRSVAGLA